MIDQQKLDALIARFEALEASMSTASDGEEIVRLSKEHGELRPVVEKARALSDVRQQIADLTELAESDDAEMAEMAAAELEEHKQSEPGLQEELQFLLLPKDKADDSSVIVEVRAGTGGDEAALFAGDLFRMYQRFAQLEGWKVEVLTMSESEVGGY
ncbi:MAG: PCRF domain-containing protein, partial [Pseudomonadota bacterium]